MRDHWAKFLCRIAWHDFELEYRSSPGVFVMDGKEVAISGEVERCARCARLFFTYKDWPRVECERQDRPRPGSAQPARRMAALVIA